MDEAQTWDQVRGEWFDGMSAYQDMMLTQFRNATGVELAECSFTRNGRWLTATVRAPVNDPKDSTQWVWDDTTGEWEPKGEIDEDD